MLVCLPWLVAVREGAQVAAQLGAVVHSKHAHVSPFGIAPDVGFCFWVNPLLVPVAHLGG